MGGPARNPRKRSRPPTLEGPSRPESSLDSQDRPRQRSGDSDRRASRDRRDPARSATYQGPERRKGPRRAADLPRPLWRQPFAVLVAATLGVIAALSIEHLPSLDPKDRDPSVASEVVDPELLARAQALRDEAEALTRTEGRLDPRAHERWQSRIGVIEAARTDPHTPTQIRTELDATVAALIRVGVMPAPSP